jgi:1,4-alpha-glucan branching enzyme
MVTVTGKFVEFQFRRSGAKRVGIAGDFNGWRQDEMPMERGPDGVWRARLRLPGGCFRFRYCADGQWFTDFAAFGVEPGPYGPVGIVYVPSGPQHKEDTACLLATR